MGSKFRSAFLLSVTTLLQGADRPSIQAIRLDAQTQGIHVDGRLDEPAWALAPMVSLTQQAPRPGEACPFTTSAKVLVTPKGIYLGIRCLDPDPKHLSIHSLLRDADLTGDDTVAVVLDTSGDGRTGYFFRINAGGARQDGLISGPESYSLDWDGIWEAATTRDEGGWTAEIFIPSRTLRFNPAKDTWGLNFERFVARERVTLRWSSPTLDSRLEDMSRNGILTGLQGLERGRGFSVTPSLSGQSFRDFQTREASTRARLGVDLTAPLGEQMHGVLTLRPDFAETEVDIQRINLTRFPLLYPEKRAFFLEGANLFQFGIGLDSIFLPFFSRTIGLVNGEMVPLDAGLKVLGRVGEVSVGALGVRQQGLGDDPSRTLGTARVAWDASKNFRVGYLGTRGDPVGIARNGFDGVDLLWHTSEAFGDKNFLVGTWGGRSSGDLPAGKRDGFGIKVDYPNDLWDIAGTWNQFGDALVPALGYLPRPGTRQSTLNGSFQPRPTAPSLQWIRQAFFEVQYLRVEDLLGRVQTWQLFLAPFNIVTPQGDHFEINAQPEFERLPVPFEIVPGVVIPVGDYRFDRYRLQAESSSSRRWQVSSTVWFGDFYGGRLTQWVRGAGYTSQEGRWRIVASSEVDFGHLPWGDFMQKLVTLRNELAWSADLVLSVIAQYETESRNLGGQVRLRWTPRPELEVFLVGDRTWLNPLDTGPMRLLPQQQRVSFKVRWTFRP
jgi:hypothetical protein